MNIIADASVLELRVPFSLRQKTFPSLSILVFNRTRKRIRDLLGLMEGVRTEELSGSNLHKLSKSSYQKRTKNFSYSLPILYQNQIEKSILAMSLSLEFPTDCIGFTT